VNSEEKINLTALKKTEELATDGSVGHQKQPEKQLQTLVFVVQVLKTNHTAFTKHLG
jgi:hypothetical protein